MTEPQHPPCDVDFHQAGKGCGWTFCVICQEEYNIGQKIQDPAGYHHFPEAEWAFYAHCRTSERHQVIFNQQSRNMRATLQWLEDWPNIRARAKERKTPEYARLLALFW